MVIVEGGMAATGRPGGRPTVLPLAQAEEEVVCEFSDGWLRMSWGDVRDVDVGDGGG